MKRNVLIVLASFLVTFIGNAQPPNYDDLVILFADAKYEKLIDECLKYNDKAATKKDVIPFLYLSKGYYAISQQGDRKDEYKNAFKYAVTAIGKFYKKDRAGAYKDEDLEFVETIRGAAAEIMMNEFEEKNYRKAASSARLYKKASPDNYGASFMEAACKYLDKDISSAMSMWRELEKPFLELKDENVDSPADIRVYKEGVKATVECMIKSRQVDRARRIADKGLEIIGEEDFKEEIDELF